MIVEHPTDKQRDFSKYLYKAHLSDQQQQDLIMKMKQEHHVPDQVEEDDDSSEEKSIGFQRSKATFLAPNK